VVATAVVVSRLLLLLLGVSFNAGFVRTAWQSLDPMELRFNLLESIFYQHSQPPLFNLWIGVMLKVFPEGWETALRISYALLGLAHGLALYALLWRVGLGRVAATVLAVAASVAPSALLYENWLFYDYPVAVGLILSALALLWYADAPSSFWRGLTFFSLLAAVVLTRSLFHPIFMVVVIGLVAVLLRRHWRTTLLACAVPILVVGLALTKNVVLFGIPSLSSWTGMNLAKITILQVPPKELRRLVRQGEVSSLSLVKPFQTADAYAAHVPPRPPTGITVLDQRVTSTGNRNLNHRAIVDASNQYTRDALAVIADRPRLYLQNVRRAWAKFLEPSTRYPSLVENRAQIQPYDNLFNRVFHELGRPVGGLSSGATAVYALALLSGAFLAAPLVRRERITPVIVVACFMWFTVAYVCLVGNTTEFGENQRFRGLVDSLAIVLVAWGARQVLPAVRPALERARGGRAELVEREAHGRRE